MFEDGDVPRKNVDVMKEALAAVKASQGESEVNMKFSSKKCNISWTIFDLYMKEFQEVPTGTKRKLEEPVVEGSEEPVKKKKKKKKKAAEAEEPSEEAETKVFFKIQFIAEWFNPNPIFCVIQVAFLDYQEKTI